MSNQLSGSTSPYLLQHAQNPVDWYPWGATALEKARREEKPIFLSIGYAACHWCHVMAHESFEDPACAAILNRHFVAIKVDREERPDLDSIYMDAVVRISGQGGWPMSVFLTPDLQPFYAGTYFPPLPRHGLPAFSDLLLSVAEAWQERRAEVLRAGAQMAELIAARAAPQPGVDDLDPALLANAGARLLTTYDRVYGGWGAAPKFPQPMLIEFLFRRHLSGDERALPAALHALRAMAQGAMHDLIGGGFARYAVDAEWRVPHFEKMLYDNALLAPVYLHAYQLSGDLFFRQVCLDTLAFLARELRSPAGGFYSSLDADSEGEEGRFYAWTHAELRQALGADEDLFSAAHELPAGGNWEGKIILRRSADDRTLAARFALPPGEVESRLRAAYARLFAVRSSRPRPATDDKVLAAWNGLALAAFAEAGRVLDDPALLETARMNAAFLLEALAPGERLRRVWRQGVAGQEVFLDDHAALILGLLELYQADFDPRWYAAADRLARTMTARFTDSEGGFFDTPADAPALLTRPQDVQDNTVPSGGALAAEALLRLYAYGGESAREAAALAAIARVAPQAERYPAAFGRWLCAADFYLHPGPQVALVGDPNDGRMRAFREALRAYDPRRVIAASAFPAPAGAPALLDEKTLLGGAPAAYVCRGFVCLRPVTDAPGLKAALSAEVV